MAYEHLEVHLRQGIMRPTEYITMQQFMKVIADKYVEWEELYPQNNSEYKDRGYSNRAGKGGLVNNAFNSIYGISFVIILCNLNIFASAGQLYDT